MIDQEWMSPPKRLALAGDQVHVWRATLDVSPQHLQVFERTLTPDEWQRATRFRFPHIRQRFIAGRGILRTILSGYLDVAPHTLRFGYTSYGKPFLESREGQQAQLHFNVTHAEGRALYAITQARAVGIDIEAQREMTDAAAIAKRFFSPLENRILHSLPAADHSSAFLRCWTRKEAYIKAQGMGLSLPLKQFSVTLAPGDPARLLRTDHEPTAIDQWTLRELAPGPGYVAALAVEGHDWQMACWQWLS